MYLVPHRFIIFELDESLLDFKLTLLENLFLAIVLLPPFEQWFIVQLLCYLVWTTWMANDTKYSYRNLILLMVQLGTALWVLALVPMLHILLVAFCTFPLIRFISFSSRQLLNHWTIDNFHNCESCLLGRIYFKIL